MAEIVLSKEYKESLMSGLMKIKNVLGNYYSAKDKYVFHIKEEAGFFTFEVVQTGWSLLFYYSKSRGFVISGKSRGTGRDFLISKNSYIEKFFEVFMSALSEDIGVLDISVDRMMFDLSFKESDIKVEKEGRITTLYALRERK